MPGKKILLFTGAGTSIPSNLPCTKQITESLLTGSWRGERDKFDDGWIFHPHDKSPKHPSDPTDLVQSFLKLLKSYADGFYALRAGQETNYEDLFYLAGQIRDDAVNAVENPAIGKFVDELKARTARLQQALIPYEEKNKFAGLAELACLLTHWVIFHKLSRKDEKAKGLDLVGKLATDPTIEKLDICTLNHDLLFECYLQSEKVELNDGFYAENDNPKVRFFNYSNFDVPTKVRLFKLHGSINWLHFKLKQDGNDLHKFGIPVNNDPLHFDDGKIKIARVTPTFLTGTYNKPAAYGVSIFADLHSRFHLLLREHNTILISGYGWGDSGINQRLFEWLLHPPKNRMILMHNENEIELPKLLRPHMPELIKRGLVLKTGKWMSGTRDEDIFKLLGWR